MIFVRACSPDCGSSKHEAGHQRCDPVLIRRGAFAEVREAGGKPCFDQKPGDRETRADNDADVTSFDRIGPALFTDSYAEGRPDQAEDARLVLGAAADPKQHRHLEVVNLGRADAELVALHREDGLGLQREQTLSDRDKRPGDRPNALTVIVRSRHLGEVHAGFDAAAYALRRRDR
jgi:hypothetical protein